MPKIFIHIILIFFIISAGCSENKQRLLVDEIYISKHNVAPPLNDKIIKFDPANFGKQEFKLIKPCQKSLIIFKEAYTPKIIASINSSGMLYSFLREDFYLHDLGKDKCPKQGYIKKFLSDSLINYINREIKRMDYEKLDTLYAGSGEGFVEYFISIKKGDNEKQIMLMQDYKVTNIIRALADSLYNYVNALELSDTLTIPNRRDTLIVLKTKKYWDKRYPSYKLYIPE